MVRAPYPRSAPDDRFCHQCDRQLRVDAGCAGSRSLVSAANTGRPARLAGGVRGSRACVNERGSQVLSTVTIGQGLEAALAAGRILCPECNGSLAPWGWAREREVRRRHGGRLLRPRRAYCKRCARTHVLLPACCVPRRRDGAEVIGCALLAKPKSRTPCHTPLRFHREQNTSLANPSVLHRSQRDTVARALVAVNRLLPGYLRVY